jgi:hypothetical protein
LLQETKHGCNTSLCNKRNLPRNRGVSVTLHRQSDGYCVLGLPGSSTRGVHGMWVNNRCWDLLCNRTPSAESNQEFSPSMLCFCTTMLDPHSPTDSSNVTAIWMGVPATSAAQPWLVTTTWLSIFSTLWKSNCVITVSRLIQKCKTLSYSGSIHKTQN